MGKPWENGKTKGKWKFTRPGKHTIKAIEVMAHSQLIYHDLPTPNGDFPVRKL